MTEKIHNIATAAKEALNFITSCKHEDPEFEKNADNLIGDVGQFVNKSRAFSEVLGNCKTVGVFGASQAGKSYLVSRLAMGESSSVNIKWDDNTFDFIKHINPEGGGKETSAFVTRFSHQKHPYPQGYPVELRVFKETEIVMILLNSFFNDFDVNTIDFDFSKLDFDAHLTSLDNEKYRKFAKDESPCTIEIEDLIELSLYLQKASNGFLKALDINHKFFLYGREHIKELNLEGRLHYFSILWSNLNVYKALYLKIVGELIKLKGAQRIYAPIYVFLKKDLTPRPDTIIKVEALQNMLACAETVEVALDSQAQEIASIEYASLAAIICEFYLSPEEVSGNLANFDILDLPGARSRETNSQRELVEEDKDFNGKDFKPGSLIDKTLNEKFRRGKVAYLFDRYSMRGEFEVLIYCISAASPNQEIRSLTTIVKDFINTNIGSTAEARSRVKNTLVGVYTQFDVALNSQFENISSGKPLDAQDRMKSLMELFSGEDWLVNFASGKCFDNFYIVRNPKYSKDCVYIERDGAGEVAITDSCKEDLKKIVDDYCASPTFISHVKNPKKSFVELLKLNDGGVTYLSDSLAEEYGSSEDREGQFESRLAATLSDIVKKLKVYADFAGEDRRIEERVKARDIALELLQCDSLTPILCELKERLDIGVDVFAKAYIDNFHEGNNAASFARCVMNLLDEKLLQLKEGSSNKQLTNSIVYAFKRAKKGLNDKATPFFFTDGVLKTESELQKAVSFTITRFANLISVIAKSELLDLENTLATALNENELRSSRAEELSVIQSRVSADFISSFVENFGFEYLKDLRFTQYLKVSDGIYGQVYEAIPDSELTALDKKAFFDSGLVFTQGIVKISNDNRSFSYRHKLNFMSNLIGVSELVNSKQKSKYQFTKEHNDMLCKIVKALENGTAL